MAIQFEKNKDVLIDEIKFCDFCKMVGRTRRAAVDGATKADSPGRGQWANMCTEHHDLWGVGLGLGAGQRLHVRSEVILSDVIVPKE